VLALFSIGFGFASCMTMPGPDRHFPYAAVAFGIAGLASGAAALVVRSSSALATILAMIGLLFSGFIPALMLLMWSGLLGWMFASS